VLTQAYADGVDPLVFRPPNRGPDATPEELAVAKAAAEAAMKIDSNKQARRLVGVRALHVLALLPAAAQGRSRPCPAVA
jgi:hypothetical protein